MVGATAFATPDVFVPSLAYTRHVYSLDPLNSVLLIVRVAVVDAFPNHVIVEFEKSCEFAAYPNS